ncbi:uncharacterized protein FIBRA_02865 [Fibroporia radiculosa]|uniref:F-box domain-containing protein n=1 Tax=Fibroporia radiculosa TaxID=599839 RepID=J4G336_9APHY|nr:uncharacterized protein FIBRA_02865 [Fibroporia radiculosa]CCM00823.1 predicted protein [Fibroporia radiculosa]
MSDQDLSEGTRSITQEALRCDDILAEIFQYLHPSSMTSRAMQSDCQRALVCCARVNKAFSHYALNSIWCELDNEKFALNILPSFQEIVYNYGRRYRTSLWDRLESTYVRILPIAGWLKVDAHLLQHLQGEISPAEVERFHSYAIRVRSIRVSAEEKPGIRSVVIQQIAALTGGCLFPALNRLECSYYEMRDSLKDIIPSMLSPTLQHLFIGEKHVYNLEDKLERDLESTIQDIVTTCTLLRQVELYGLCKHVDVVSLVNACKDLRDISMPLCSVSNAVFRGLSALPKLTKLSLNIHQIDIEAGTCRQFCTLTELKLGGSDRQMSDFILSGEFHTVQMLEIAFTSVSSMESAHTCLLHVASKCSASLRILRLGLKNGSQICDGALVDLISPFSPAIHLRSIRVNLCSMKVTYAAGNFQQFAFTWPEIEDFTLGYACNDAIRFEPHTSCLQMLFDIASVFPRLRNVTLPSLEPLPHVELQTYGLTQHGLERAAFKDGEAIERASLDDAPIRRLLTLLVSIFPTLKLDYNGTGWEYLRESYTTIFKEMMKQMSKIQQMKMEESTAIE